MRFLYKRRSRAPTLNEVSIMQAKDKMESHTRMAVPERSVNQIGAGKRGMPGLRSGNPGDQLVRVQVEVPTHLTADQ